MYCSLQQSWSRTPSAAEIIYKKQGLVKTKGTIYLLPPSRDVLIKSYLAPPRPKTLMSSGAVALCKHFERGGASAEHGRAHPFWPLPVGSNGDKNTIAERVLDEMLTNPAWRNMMMLHPGVAVYEVRNQLGFGMRWTLHLAEPAVEGGTPENSEGSCEHQVPDAEKAWTITKVQFRGFLEPVEGRDDELPQKSQA